MYSEKAVDTGIHLEMAIDTNVYSDKVGSNGTEGCVTLLELLKSFRKVFDPGGGVI